MGTDFAREMNLLLVVRIEPEIIENDGVGGRQVNAETTSLRMDKVSRRGTGCKKRRRDPRGDEVDKVVLVKVIELVYVVLALSDINVTVQPHKGVFLAKKAS